MATCNINTCITIDRVHQLLKDFCGVVTEASLKANIVLVYEVIEELLVSCKVKNCSEQVQVLRSTMGMTHVFEKGL